MIDNETVEKIRRMKQESHLRMEQLLQVDAQQALAGMQAFTQQMVAARLEASKHLARGKHERAGITKNKGRGQSKARRKMAKASRRKHQG